MTITLFISGRDYDRAPGSNEITLPDGSDVAAALSAIVGTASDPPPWSAHSLVAVSGRHLGPLAGCGGHVLRDGDELMVITPVSGG